MAQSLLDAPLFGQVPSEDQNLLAVAGLDEVACNVDLDHRAVAPTMTRRPDMHRRTPCRNRAHDFGMVFAQIRWIHREELLARVPRARSQRR